MRGINKNVLLFGLLALGYGVTFVFISAHYSSPNETQALQRRADRLFAYDRKYQHRLPLNRLASLSIALEFGNETGARQIIDQLEPLVND